MWSKVDLTPQPAAIEAAKKADVVIAVVGITSELEGEEMQVSEPGFLGGDRTSLDLPKPEEDLLQALAGTHKPLVVVLTNGSALGGELGQRACECDSRLRGTRARRAATRWRRRLPERTIPAGRLPVTFYTGVSQLPNFEDYSMKGRTYRYFEGQAALPIWLWVELHDFLLQRSDVPA